MSRLELSVETDTYGQAHLELTDIHTLSLFGMLGTNRRIIRHDNYLHKGFNIEA